MAKYNKITEIPKPQRLFYTQAHNQIWNQALNLLDSNENSWWPASVFQFVTTFIIILTHYTYSYALINHLTLSIYCIVFTAFQQNDFDMI